MPTTAAVAIVTGVPFAATFNNGTATFTIAGNQTSYFFTDALVTVPGGGANSGYQIVLSSVFSGGNTVVTVASYSTGTAYPGPATFTTGSGTVLWFNATGTPPSPPFPASTDLLAIVDGNFSKFVTTGGAGTILTSTNGTTSWVSQTSGVSTNLWNTTSAFSTDYVVGDSGTLLHSTNDTSWTANNQGSHNLYGIDSVTMYQGVHAIQGAVIAVGAAGVIYTSADGSTWTSQSSGVSVDLHASLGSQTMPEHAIIVG